MGDVGGGAQEGTFRFSYCFFVRSVFECHIFTLFMTIISHLIGLWTLLWTLLDHCNMSIVLAVLGQVSPSRCFTRSPPAVPVSLPASGLDLYSIASPPFSPPRREVSE